MLDNLRNFGKSWIAKILLGLLLIAVAGFGVPSVFLDLNANTVARVGTEQISTRSFDAAYRNQLNGFAQQTGITPTAEQSLAYGIPGMALSQLAAEASVIQIGQRLELGASDEKLAQFIARDPSFGGALGEFDPSLFKVVLRQSNITENEYLNMQRKVAMREQLGSMFTGIKMPAIAREIANAYANERRTIEYTELNPVLYASSDEPTEEELTQFFTENQNRFRTQETRKVSLLPLTAEALAPGIEISDEEIAAEYERTKQNYVTIEQRTIEQLNLENDEQIARLTAAKEAGENFDVVAEELGLTSKISRLGIFAQSQLADASLSRTAFELEEGKFDIIDSPLGKRAVYVSKITPAGVQSLDSLRDTLRTSLQTTQARAKLLTAYDEIDENRAAFLPLQDVADRNKLQIYDLDITRDPMSIFPVTTIPASAQETVISQIFAANPEATLAPAINLGSNRFVFFDIKEVLPVRDLTLEEVRPQVIAAWQDLQSELAITSAAEEIVADLDSGEDFFALTAAHGQTAQTSAPFTRDGLDDGLISAEVARAVFSGIEGSAGYAAVPNGNIIVYQITDITPVGEDANTELADSLDDSFANLLYVNFIEAVQRDTPMRINEEALNLVIGIQ